MMIQINYGEKSGRGFVEVLSRKGSVLLKQPSMLSLSATEWLIQQGVNLELRTKDRLEFQSLLPVMMKEVGLNQTLHFIFELKENGVVTSNEALIPLKESFSGSCLDEALQKLFTC